MSHACYGVATVPTVLYQTLKFPCYWQAEQKCELTRELTDVCKIVAGDGYRAGNETCDDDNLLPDDGFSNLMKIETGDTCEVDLNGKSICKKCGNGRLETNEVCDDADVSRWIITISDTSKNPWYQGSHLRFLRH
jgi:cysteine-rich repeat protein